MVVAPTFEQTSSTIIPASSISINRKGNDIVIMQRQVVAILKLNHPNNNPVPEEIIISEVMLIEDEHTNSIIKIKQGKYR